MSRYTPSRNYFSVGMIAGALGLISAWFAIQWMPAAVPSVIFLALAGLAVFLATRPPIEIHPRYLRVGSKTIAWADVLTVDRTGWISPLVVFLTLADGSRHTLVYPGNLEGSNSLLRQLRRHAEDALIDGVPYSEFWGQAGAEWTGIPEAAPRKQLAAPRSPVLPPEEEAEIERLYQRLKTVGHLDPKNYDE
jgi:hypothetical protein